jgi:hypothetical protein
MGRLADLAKDRVHMRTIEMSNYAVDGTQMLSIGHFKDVRLSPSFFSAGNSRPAGTLHDLEICVLLRIPELTIEKIEVAVNTVPLEDCHSLAHSLDPLIGSSIARGFTNAVKEQAGGTKGCTHLVHLLSTMAPAILQGFWALQDRKETDSEDTARAKAASSARFLKNSCYAWREDGAAYRELIGKAGG